ncbi:MAG: BatD family protein [Candidatus Omnitrophica bacterium]|nr:BatD family protein [Candidatus Omnitrophota bacterium]
MKRISIITLIIIGITAAITTAADIQFEVSVERSQVVVGEPVQLYFTFHGTNNLPPPDLPKINDFKVNYLGPSSSISIVNGVVNSSITHVFTLLPLKTGKFTLGPFSVKVNQKTYQSKPIEIEVISAPTGQLQPNRPQTDSDASLGISREDLKDRIFIVLSIPKRKLFINELVPISVKLYVNNLAVRDIHLPVLESKSFSIEAFGQPRQYREQLAGIIYDVVEFSTNLFAIKPGEFTLGPAKLSCNLVVRKHRQRIPSVFDDDFFSGFFKDDIFDDFFGRYELFPMELESTAIPLVILDLPEEGKPTNFNGAIGDFNLIVNANPLTVKAGDPITVTIVVKGEGNLDTVKAPQPVSEEGFKVYPPQVRKEKDSKIFEQVFIPLSERVTNLPEITFSFFNPRTQTYQEIRNPAIPITVLKSEEQKVQVVDANVPEPQIKKQETLGKDILYIKTSSGKWRKRGLYLYQTFGYWLFNIIIFISFVITFILLSFRQRLSQDEQFARRLQAPLRARRRIKELEAYVRKRQNQQFFDAIFNTLREYLADRFHLKAASLTLDIFESFALQNGITQEILAKIRNIYEQCEKVRYAPLEANSEHMQDLLKQLKEIITYFEAKR